METAAYKGLDTLKSFKAQVELGQHKRVFNPEMERRLHAYLNAVRDFADDKSADAKAIETSSCYRLLTELWVAVCTVFNIAIAFFLALYFNLGTVLRLNTVMDNTFRLAARQPLNPLVGGSDEIAHLDKVFHQMAFDLEEASRRKQELVSMVSHDLRTPLMSVQTSLELLFEGVLGQLPEKARSEVSIAQYSTTRLIQLINDLLDIDKMEAGKFDIAPRRSDIGWIFERCVGAGKSICRKASNHNRSAGRRR